jgi:tetratricopeptide (TPR) repeat protein
MKTTLLGWSVPRVALALLALAFAWPLAAEPAATAGIGIAKDVGPANSACDAYAKDTEGWRACVGEVRAEMPDKELFYAGYWLAKTGHFQEALAYLTRARNKDERVLTYIGFAKRKLGDVDGALPYYAQALAKNPDYSVARAYLGEAFLTRREPEKAKAELAEIEKRCGRSCAEYADLAQHIAHYEAARG